MIPVQYLFAFILILTLSICLICLTIRLRMWSMTGYVISIAVKVATYLV